MMIFQKHYIENNPYLDYKDQLPDFAELEARRKHASRMLGWKNVRMFGKNLEHLSGIRTEYAELSSPTVRFGREDELDAKKKKVLDFALRDLKPWRKGPFEYFGTHLDAEWRSDLKWDRIVCHMAPDLQGKRVCDVGCNNMYYMYRMLPQEPELVLGLDPFNRYYLYYYLNNLIYPRKEVRFDLLGIQDLDMFTGFFDVIFCLGVLYHRRDPLASLDLLKQALKPGGKLYIENAGIPGDEPYCLFPESRYMKAPGYWFLPTASALKAMVKRSGFINVKVHTVVPTTTQEQRKTQWINTESYGDFVKADNPNLTVEGYPAPLRMYVEATVK
ncbi:MAG: tRNA 5-methoxyuridine(34)/uridine 5-oxyacetic acid(34) synthase CmoB [Spirochaetia bacterium]